MKRHAFKITRYCLIGILILSLIIASGCIKRGDQGSEKIPTKTSSPTPALPAEKITPAGNNWLYEGIIYETHPYYYDGTFKSLTQQIPTIKDMGVKTIYLMPIWDQPKGKERNPQYIYHISDYYKINPVYGTSQEFKELVETIHNHDMKIVLDFVTCCAIEGDIGWTNKWILRKPLSEIENLGLKLDFTTKDGIKYVSSDCISTVCQLAGRIDGDNVLLFHPRVSLGYAIDRTNPDVITYFTNVASYYVKEYDIDGWRVDLAANNYDDSVIKEDYSSVELLKSVRAAVTEAKSSAVLITESPSTIRPQEYYDLYHKMPEPTFDIVADASYSYIFENQAVKFKTTQELKDFFSDEIIFYNRSRLRFLETHDSVRINAKAPQLNKPLIVLISTVPGIPMIQAGEEIGAKNDWIYSKSDPKVNWNGDSGLRNFYKKVFEIRNSNNALKYGTIENIWKSGDNSLAYTRSYDDQKVIVLLNYNNKNVISTLDLSFLKTGAILYDELNDEQFDVNDPKNFEIGIPAFGSRILVNR